MLTKSTKKKPFCLPAEKSQKGEKRKQNGGKDKGKERRKSSPEKKKERLKSESSSLLKELGTLCAFVCVFSPESQKSSKCLKMCLCLCIRVKDLCGS